MLYRVDEARAKSLIECLLAAGFSLTLWVACFDDQAPSAPQPQPPGQEQPGPQPNPQPEPSPNSNPDQGGPEQNPGQNPGQQNPQDITETLCSFNIQFLGNSKVRDNRALAQILVEKGCSLILVQEIVAPPDVRVLPGNEFFGQETLPVFPGTQDAWRPSSAVTEFFQAMIAAGFDGYWISEQDTGMSEKNQNNGSATEWFVTFYKSSTWKKAKDLPHGFLAEDVTAHPEMDRVAYATAFRHVSERYDFVAVNAHLRPNGSAESRRRRLQEMQFMKAWTATQKQQKTESNFFLIGDMNIEDQAELQNIQQSGWISLNTDARQNTNTNIRNPKPYDHVFLLPQMNPEVQLLNNFKVTSLIEVMRKFWTDLTREYPGDPYRHDLFRFYYSDHHPVSFEINLPLYDLD